MLPDCWSGEEIMRCTEGGVQSLSSGSKVRNPRQVSVQSRDAAPMNSSVKDSQEISSEVK